MALDHAGVTQLPNLQLPLMETKMGIIRPLEVFVVVGFSIVGAVLLLALVAACTVKVP
jgi:hypothetical protein